MKDMAARTGVFVASLLVLFVWCTVRLGGFGGEAAVGRLEAVTRSWMPIGYLGLALLLVVVLLPTALRPPHPPPPPGQKFSPDEPPDNSQIVNEFNRGHSRTAGSGLAVAPPT